MADEERRTFYANVRVELKGVTADEAREFWRALADNRIEVGDASVIAVSPEVVKVEATGTSTGLLPDRRDDSSRYWGD